MKIVGFIWLEEIAEKLAAKPIRDAIWSSSSFIN